MIDKLVKDTPCYMIVCDDGSGIMEYPSGHVVWSPLYLKLTLSHRHLHLKSSLDVDAIMY